MRIKSMLMLFMAASVLGGVSLLSGCEKEPETPGEALDQAIEQTGEAMEEMGDKVEDAAN